MEADVLEPAGDAPGAVELAEADAWAAPAAVPVVQEPVGVAPDAVLAALPGATVDALLDAVPGALDAQVLVLEDAWEVVEQTAQDAPDVVVVVPALATEVVVQVVEDGAMARAMEAKLVPHAKTLVAPTAVPVAGLGAIYPALSTAVKVPQALHKVVNQVNDLKVRHVTVAMADAEVEQMALQVVARGQKVEYLERQEATKVQQVLHLV